MNIYLAQLNPIVGDIDGNVKKICSVIDGLFDKDVDLVVFSECVLSGYPAGDLLTYDAFIDQIHQGIDFLIQYSKKIPSTAIVLGTPYRVSADLYNSILVIQGGELLFSQYKTLLPNYDVFDEMRYFKQNDSFKPFQFKGKSIGLTVCEDIWTDNITGKQRYKVNPLSQLALESLDFIINISASPFEDRKHSLRESLFSQQAIQMNIPIVVVNQVGGNDHLIFDGGSFVLSKTGTVVNRCAFFKEDGLLINLDESCTGKVLCSDTYQDFHDLERLLQALVLGIRDYVNKTGFKDVVIGLSGGIDSALVCALATLALGSNHVHGVSMPSPYSSQGSLDDAKQLAENCGIRYSVIPISETFDQFNRALSTTFEGKKKDVTEENIQSRIRGTLLMALSNKNNALLLSTGNKSEVAMGYCTLYGDMCGALSVIADVPKTKVYDLARYINQKQRLIPDNSILKPPSAELRPGQVDSDSLPPYDQLDRIIYLYVEEGKSLDSIVEYGYDKSLVEDVVKKININEYKRQQAPLVLRVTSKSFGMGRRMPIAARYAI